MEFLGADADSNIREQETSDIPYIGQYYKYIISYLYSYHTCDKNM